MTILARSDLAFLSYSLGQILRGQLVKLGTFGAYNGHLNSEHVQHNYMAKLAMDWIIFYSISVFDQVKFEVTGGSGVEN